MARLVRLSVVAGVMLGLAARVVMRLVALESGLDPGFSLGGSLEVMAFGGLVGAPAAAAFLIVRGRLLVAGWWPGLVFGAALFVALTLAQPPAARSAMAGTPDTPAATVLAFAAMFVGWGGSLEWLARRPPGTRLVP
jgi:hypothetical protein